MSHLPPLSTSMQTLVQDAATQLGLDDIAEALAHYAAPAWFLAPTDRTPASAGHGVGGLPTVGPGFVWPESLSFVAQIDLSALPPDIGLTLPQHGTLQFFVDAEKQENGSCTGQERRGAIYWQQSEGDRKGQPPGALASRAQDGVFSPLPFEIFPGLSLTPLDSDLLNLVVIDDQWWGPYAKLSRNLRGLAAPTPARNRGRIQPVADEDWLQIGGHIQYFKDGTFIDFRLGAVLEKQGFAREFALGADAVRQQIRQYQATIPDWCRMLQSQLELFERQRHAFEEDANHLVLLLTLPSLPQIGVQWADDGFVSFVIDDRDLAHNRLDQAWVLFHP